MIQSLSLVIPVVLSLIAIFVFGWNLKNKLLWIFFGSSLIISSLCCIFVPLLGTIGKTSFNEVWSYKNVKVQHYEDWDERVSCRHPIYKTEYYYDYEYDSVKKKNVKVRKSREVLVGYQHSYDIDYHPEHCVAVNEYGSNISIDKNTYHGWVNIWKNSKFVELNRSYHSKDGNMRESVWPGNFDTIYPQTTIHTYENKVRVSDSIFKYQEPTKELIEKYKRPSDTNMVPMLYYGLNANHQEVWRLNQLNAELGVNKKVYILVLFFNADEYSMGEVENVKSAWQGPNKNELVICIGRKPSNEIVWCDSFSWMDDTTCQVKIRQNVLESKTFNIEPFINNVRENVNKHWVKKDFKEFSYLTVESPTWSNVLAVVLSLVLNACLGIFLKKYELEALN